MKITAVIAEYNPLHNGHVCHLDAIRRETGTDFIIAVISGDYVQRGGPAVISKYERTRSVLKSGADLVLELPLYYSTGSLEYFSRGAVSLIGKTGLCDCISFGSECGDINLLKEAAAALDNEGGPDKDTVLNSLANGINYPNIMNRMTGLNDNARDLLRSPNNLLAVSYIRASTFLGLDIDHHTVKRFGSEYHDSSSGALSSTALRDELLKAYGNSDTADDNSHCFKCPDTIKDRMPDDVFSSLCDHLYINPPLCEDDFSMLLFYKVQQCLTSEGCCLTDFLDVSANIAGRLKNNCLKASSFTDLCKAIKSKDVAYSRISRALLHILLDITLKNMNEYIFDGYNYYLRVLGFKKDSKDLLHKLKKSSSVPIIVKTADAESTIRAHYMSDNQDVNKCSHALRMFSEGLRATDLYNKTACFKNRQKFISEYEHPLIII
ncbi:MAG: nucleotidyltransferase family protein [Lachnospiraceae bacterium]|nr:nucleotidyltransferase family protein [Lachnospiraceae bacterium]